MRAQSGIPVREIALTPEQAKTFREQGHIRAPLTILRDEIRSGFWPDLIGNLKKGPGELD